MRKVGEIRDEYNKPIAEIREYPDLEAQAVDKISDISTAGMGFLGTIIFSITILFGKGIWWGVKHGLAFAARGRIVLVPPALLILSSLIFWFIPGVIGLVAFAVYLVRFTQKKSSELSLVQGQKQYGMMIIGAGFLTHLSVFIIAPIWGRWFSVHIEEVLVANIAAVMVYVAGYSIFHSGTSQGSTT